MPYLEPTANRIFRQTRPDSIFRPHAIHDPESAAAIRHRTSEKSRIATKAARDESQNITPMRINTAPKDTDSPPEEMFCD